MPTESMGFWSPQAWNSWLVDGVRAFIAGDREERALAFAPIAIDPDTDGPPELFFHLRSVVDPIKLMNFEEGLSFAVSGWSWEDGGKSASFFVELAGLTEGAAPRRALQLMLQKPINVKMLSDADELANAIAFVLSKRAHPSMIRELKPLLTPLLQTSPSAAVLVVAREAVDNASLIVSELETVFPELFTQEPDQQDWRFVINKIIERAGVERSLEAAYINQRPNTLRFRRALELNRLRILDHGPSPNFETCLVLDRSTGVQYEIPTRMFQGDGIYPFGMAGVGSSDTPTSYPTTHYAFGKQHDVMAWIVDQKMRVGGLGSLFEPTMKRYDPPGDDEFLLGVDD